MCRRYLHLVWADGGTHGYPVLIPRLPQPQAAKAEPINPTASPTSLAQLSIAGRNQNGKLPRTCPSLFRMQHPPTHVPTLRDGDGPRTGRARKLTRGELNAFVSSSCMPRLLMYLVPTFPPPWRQIPASCLVLVFVLFFCCDCFVFQLVHTYCVYSLFHC